MDTLTKSERSFVMSLVRAKGTNPEKLVRKLVTSLGVRYRLHDKKLPGCPDLVFKKRNKLIFVHGCFWHRHKGCPNCRDPKSRTEFWLPKLEGNRIRDKKNLLRLGKMGWKTLVVWECELKRPSILLNKLRKFLGDLQ